MEKLEPMRKQQKIKATKKALETAAFTPYEESKIYELASQRETESQKKELQRSRTNISLASILNAGKEAGYDQKTLESCAEEVLAGRKENKATGRSFWQTKVSKIVKYSIPCVLSMGIIGSIYICKTLIPYDNQEVETPIKQEQAVRNLPTYKHNEQFIRLRSITDILDDEIPGYKDLTVRDVLLDTPEKKEDDEIQGYKDLMRDLMVRDFLFDTPEKKDRAYKFFIQNSNYENILKGGKQ